jgi:hypothetical protein
MSLQTCSLLGHFPPISQYPRVEKNGAKQPTWLQWLQESSNGSFPSVRARVTRATRLATAASAILAQKPDCQIGDLAEELKHDLLICLTEAEKEKSLVH